MVHTSNLDRLQSLGLTTAAYLTQLREQRSVEWATAYAHYRFVTPDQLAVFRQRCGRELTTVNGQPARKELVLTPLKDYPFIPPKEVLHALEAAQAHRIFDSFTIASLQQRVMLRDPILFGQITGCPDYFVIASWGKDISVEDLAGGGESPTP